MDNMKYYKMGKEVPKEAKKTITKGKLAGYTDINPSWRIKKLTEMFGPCGLGWYTQITREWTEKGSGNEVLYFVKLNLFVKYDGEWSKPIEGVGGNKSINDWSKRSESNDEALKMSETDAISVACKKLGIAADVYFEKDRTKYDLEPEPNQEQNQEQKTETNDSWEKGIKTQTTQAKNTNSDFTPVSEEQRKYIFGLIAKKAINKELLDEWLIDNYKKTLSKCNKTEGSQIITFVNKLLEQKMIDKLLAAAKKKGFSSKAILKKTELKHLEYLTDVDYQQLINGFNKLPDKEEKNNEK